MTPILILLLFLSSGSGAAKIYSKLELQSDNQGVLEHFLLIYFDKTHLVTVVNVNVEFGEPEDAIKILNHPFQVINSKNLRVMLESNTNAYNFASFSILEGYLIRFPVLDRNIFNKVMGRLSKLNPRARYLIAMKGASVVEIFALLNELWSNFKILNAIVIVSGENGIHAHFINPFAAKGSPSVYTEFLTEDNFNKTTTKIFSIIKRRIENLQKFPLRINMFEMPMQSRARYDSNNNIVGYDYADGEILDIMSEKMNFTSIFLPDTALENYGFRLPNKTFTGSYAAIEYGHADLAANSRIIANIGTKNSLFLHPFDVAKLMYVVPRDYYSDRIAVVSMDVFDQYSSIFYMIYFCTLPFLVYLLKYVEKAILPSFVVEAHRTVGEYFLLFWSLNHNVPIFWLPKCTHNRLIFFTVMVYSLVMCSIFQGNMIKNVNTAPQNNMNSIAEVLNSDLEIYCHNVIASILAKTNIKRSHKIETNSYLVVQNMTRDRNVALLSPHKFVLSFYIYFYDTSTGADIIHTVPEVLAEFYSSMLAPKTSPFLEKMNELIMRCVENGVVEYQNNRAIDDFLNLYFERFKNVTKPENQLASVNLIGLLELQDILRLYRTGMIAAGVCLILEIAYGRIIRKYLRK